MCTNIEIQLSELVFAVYVHEISVVATFFFDDQLEGLSLGKTNSLSHSEVITTFPCLYI